MWPPHSWENKMGEQRKHSKGGIGHRKPADRRLVREVTYGQRAPKYWTAMAIAEDECKLMEVRKFSSEYFELDSKFRRPGLELISGYAIQNAFLWGQYLLRREQLKMQLVSSGQTVKEKDFFCKTEFENFERIARQNFDPRWEGDPQAGITFYSDPLAADDSKPDADNIRVMIMTKVLVGTCMMKTEEAGAASMACSRNLPSIHEKTGLPVDTMTDSSKTTFVKFCMAEVYPEFILVYRKKTGERDTRKTQLRVQHVKLSYRAGTRFNPQEQLEEEPDQEQVDDVDKIESAGVFAETGLVNVTNKEVTIKEEKKPVRKRSGWRKLSSMFEGKEKEKPDDEEGTQEQLMEE